MDAYGLIPGKAAAPLSTSPCLYPQETTTPGAAEPPIRILLVEDNPADVRFFREALHLSGLRYELAVVSDGEEALLYLRGRGIHEGAPRPSVIVLDLKLPRVSGHAVLGVIRLEPELKTIPVVVMTSSPSRRDEARSYDLHADHYLTKPVGIHLLAGELKILESLARRAPD
jgi:two-component system, chemotaxis family, response regulator Rcp1